MAKSTTESKKAAAATVPANPVYTQQDGTHTLVTVTDAFGNVVASLPHANPAIAGLVAAAYRG